LKRGAVEKVYSYMMPEIFKKTSQTQVRNSICNLTKIPVLLTILILEKLRSPSSVKLGVPSSINERSVRYMPR
jgi:hypothetical protein